MDGGGKSSERLMRTLLDRFDSLEASHEKLKEQLEVVVHEKDSGAAATDTEEEAPRYPGWGDMPRACFAESPYRRWLEYMGHELHVTRLGSGEIVYWNRAAEKLFGYKDYEVLGQGAVELLFDEEHHNLVLGIMERVRFGESWSGQLPLRKRSGQSFIALVTQSPLYEDGELTGIVTVSSDAAVFNKANSANMRARQDNANEQSKFRRINLKNIQCQQRQKIAGVPNFASSVSNLAPKVLSRTRGNGSSTFETCGSARDDEDAEAESHDMITDRPPRAHVAKGAFGFPIGRSRAEGSCLEKEETASEFSQPSKLAVKILEKFHIGASSSSEKVVAERIQQNGFEDNSSRKEAANGTCSPNTKSLYSEDASNGQSDSQKILGPAESCGSECGCSSSKGENDPPLVVRSAIQWEDLQLKEEIGQGSLAVVYRGIWNGSDVAVKVYTGTQYDEETLADYKKEIDIMRRLRHPNVLLFMGASCTKERIAFVTEYMNRGSLFKTLHRSNQVLDIRRRLRIALDVSTGMNYLHHRNPPIVHRDLKSSNLLVDKSWNVKVGDFGLSKLKYSTFLTARSGRGTPQWMAPEVLRNEPSTEKSDVFSFGVILWELMTERIPWSNLNAVQVVGAVGFTNSRLDIPHNVDPQIASIISECWASNPEDRPSFKDMIPKLEKLLVQASGGGVTRAASQP
ncbi:probable serine/threonine-protein kinase SIS8 [Salvia splendens]|uniref:probable serine/threonine-protein kinase SIS8 n=1 Tax=Salvia splendens TaxID=180675 RepID=UPI001C25C5E5|nr:probable serine/threonine-protein kinase SIS8 [Salvia splendens]